MKKSIIKFIFILLAVANLYAQEEEISKQIERYKRLKRRLEKKIKFPSIEDKTFTPLSSPPLYKKGKIFIKNIELENATFITQKDYLHILKKFENRYLSFKDLRNLVREITNIYRQKGFITSFAYLPPQKIKKGKEEKILGHKDTENTCCKEYQGGEKLLHFLFKVPGHHNATEDNRGV